MKTPEHTSKDTSIKRRDNFFSSKEKKNTSVFFQPQLTVGPVDDVYEREADAVADQVMRMSDDHIQTKISPLNVQRKCKHCEEEEEQLQRKERSSVQTEGEAPSIVSDAIASSGTAMDHGTQSFMENRFGYDFSNVKIHTGTTATAAAKSINALAYTSGNSIVFNEGQYAPHTDTGKKLLAHELTHTIQQSGSIGRKVQRTVDNVEINCADNEIRFQHDGETTSYTLDHCQLTDGTYDAGVTLSPARVDFDLGTVPPGTEFNFSYSIAPGQPNPNTFFRGQSRVRIVCSNTSSAAGGEGSIGFNVRQITDAEFYEMTGNGADTIPEGMMVPLSNFLERSLPSAIGPATAGASYFSPTPWSFIPRNVTGVLWTQGHTSIFSNPEGAFSPTIRGYRGSLPNYLGEMIPGAFGRQCTIQLHEGVPGSFANDAWFPLMPGEQYYVFTPRTQAQALEFASRLDSTSYGGDYTYSPPRSAPDPILGPVGTTEGSLHSELTTRGRAPMCTNNCITVPAAEIEAAMGGRPTTSSGVDVMTGTGPGGTVDPHHAGRGRLMTEAMGEGPLPPGASRLRIRVTPGGSAGMFVIRGAGRIMLVYGIYHTADRIAHTAPGDLPVVISEEAGAWTGGILGSALGGAAAGAIFCAPTGPVDAVCVVGGFLGGLIFGIAGSSVGQAIGHTVGEHVVSPVVDAVDEHIVSPVVERAAEVESEMTRGIYNLYGVPYF